MTEELLAKTPDTCTLWNIRRETIYRIKKVLCLNVLTPRSSGRTLRRGAALDKRLSDVHVPVALNFPQTALFRATILQTAYSYFYHHHFVE
jgi:hypothetical protein